MVKEKTQNLRANLSLNGHSTKIGITYWIWTDFGLREVLYRSISYGSHFMWMRAPSFLECPFKIYPTNLINLRISASLKPVNHDFQLLKIGTERRVLFSLLDKMSICGSRLPFVMVQSSWIKLIKENIIEVKQKYEQGLKKCTIWVNCFGCLRITVSLPQILLFLPINIPLKSKLVWVVFLSTATKNDSHPL